MKTDIEIAQEAKMEPIIKIAEKIGLNESVRGETLTMDELCRLSEEIKNGKN